MVGLVHLLSDGLVVACHEGVADSEDTVLLAQYEVGAFIVFGADFRLHGLQLVPVGIPQRLELLAGEVLAQCGDDVLAAPAAVVVGASCQFVLHLRVDEYQPVALWTEREVLELTAAAVQAHQLPFLSEDACELVHDTAVHADVLVLRCLSGEGDVPFRHLVAGKQVVQRTAEAALHGCR